MLRELLGRRADVRLAALLGLEEDLLGLLDLDVLDDVQERLADVLLCVVLSYLLQSCVRNTTYFLHENLIVLIR